ncbi:GntR family transcriptional regulator [Raoultibacter phocaeensis]|uniref:GntR family transcriptional regulator n=1 Tax=Raoultibacter phocaeensis TaxID=2479841 RepID=UPI001119E8CC|nr:GntR family transcriptional regulator [Raoultibacter phocaeensis]
MALLEVDGQSGIPIWVQLRNRFIYLIDSGHYQNGDKLPTVRSLAEELNINYHTVNKVYISLEHEGYIKSIRGKGAFVEKSVKTEKGLSSVDVVITECIRQCLELGMTAEDIKGRFGEVIDDCIASGSLRERTDGE